VNTRVLALAVAALVILVFGADSRAQTPTYVGTEACGACHPQEHENFTKYSKKAKSWRSVAIMAPGLTPEELRECYVCHTTGYGQPGGFESYDKTPHLSDAGCEVCHGPGSLHSEFGDPGLITRRMHMRDCESCHNAERVEAFNFKPLIYGGAH